MKYSLIFTIVISMFISFCPKTSFSQQDNSLVKFKNSSSLSAPRGYSHAAIINLGNCQMIVISGQIPLNSEGTIVGLNDFAKQTEQVFLNLKSILAGVGGTMDNVIKLGIFTTDISKIQIIRDIRDKFVNLKSPPTSTTIQVSKFIRDDILIEIEATAIIPNK